MVFRRIANVTHRLKLVYDSKPVLKTVSETVGIYCGMKVIGIGVAAIFELKEVDDLTHFAAPVFSSWYLCDRVEAIRNSKLKTVIQAAVIGAASADIARLVSDYDQGIYGVHKLRDYMSVVSDKVGNFTMVRSPEAQAFWTGVIGTGMYKKFS